MDPRPSPRASSGAAPRRLLVLNERDPEHPRAGGAEVHVARLCTRLVARGHAVTWYAARAPGMAREGELEGVRIERRGPLPAYYASVPLRLRRAQRRDELDLVVECLNKIPFYAPLFVDVPVLALCHHLFGEVAYDQASWPIATAVTLAERGLPRAYRESLFLAISESTRDDLIVRGLPPERIRVSPPGIDRPDPTRVPAPEVSRPARMTYVGRLERYKRVDLMLRAAARLVDAFPDLELRIVGRGDDRPRLERLARQLGLAGRTRFTGFVPDAERDALLAASRVCVLPSEKEGWGLTVVEANALGTPVVARDAPGLRDSVRPGETGVLVEGDDPMRWAEALAPLLTEDAASLGMRRAALEWSHRFDWDRATDDLEAAIEESLQLKGESLQLKGERLQLKGESLQLEGESRQPNEESPRRQGDDR